MTAIMNAFTPDDWKRGIALVILWAYAYQLVLWPILFYIAVIFTSQGHTFPAPPIMPWEQLMSGTATLATVGGIQAWRDNKQLASEGSP